MVAKDLYALARRFLVNQKLRFLIAGGANTASTLGVYWLLLQYFDYRVSFTVAYVSGIALSYLLNSYFVFGTRPAVRSALSYPLVYAAQYIAGLGVLWIWVALLQLPSSWGALVVAICTLPLTFLLSRAILMGKVGKR